MLKSSLTQGKILNQVQDDMSLQAGQREVYRTSTGDTLSPRIEALRRKVMGIAKRG